MPFTSNSASVREHDARLPRNPDVPRAACRDFDAATILLTSPSVFSIGSLRRSVSLSDSKSNAYRHTIGSLRRCRMRSKSASPRSSQTTASPSIRNALALIALAAVVISGYRAVQSKPLRVMTRDAGGVTLHHHAKTVVFDLMQPAGPVGWRDRFRRKTGLDPGRLGLFQLTQQAHHRRTGGRRPMSLANGGLGQHIRHDSDEINEDNDASGWRSSLRMSTSPTVWQAGHSTTRIGVCAASAVPTVGKNVRRRPRLARRFQIATKRLEWFWSRCSSRSHPSQARARAAADGAWKGYGPCRQE